MVAASLRKRLEGGPEDDGSNLVLQLGSNNAKDLGQCAGLAEELYPNLHEINLNCGCPSVSSGGAAGYGASLMKDPDLTAGLVASMCSSTKVDISVKTRIAVFDNPEDLHHRPLDDRDYRYLVNYVSSIEEAGASHVILHARPAVLSGLSPANNRIVPRLDYEFVHQIARDFDGRMKITLNGGLSSLASLDAARNKYQGRINSYMSGRFCIRRPLDLLNVEQNMLSSNRIDVHSAIGNYLSYALARRDKQQFTMAELCLPLYLVSEQLKEDYEEEEPAQLSWEDIEALHDRLQEGLVELSNGKVKPNASINFKKLTSSFKPVVGTKVVNKWKRNRAEL